MNAPRRIGLCRGAAVVLALGAAISLTALSAGMVPALADDPPYEPTDVASETAYATTTEYPPETIAPVATEPVLTPEPLPATPETTTSDSASSSTTPSFSSSSTTSTTATTQPSTESSATSSAAVSTTSGSVAASATPETSDAASPVQVSPIVEPERLQASPQDVDIAKAAITVPRNPDPAPQSEIDRIRGMLPIGETSGVNVGPDAAAPNSGANSNVLQLPPAWVGQDDNFRPVISNPLPDPLQIIYLEGGDRRILTIQPLTSALIDLAPGVYDATVMVINTVGQLREVAVASMVSGPRPDSETDVPVVVDYSAVRYKPFRVSKITDIGEDPNVGERKVLLDDATPAWGVWTQTSTGERQFEVHKTQQFPGIDTPAEGPLPGDYQLVADSEPLSSTDGLLIVLAVLIAAVALGATVARFVRRKQREQREQRSRDQHRGTHIQAVSRPGGPSGFTVCETPARGEATHAVRLAAHSEPCTLTIREVNDDHSHAE